MNWQERMEASIDYIERNLGSNLDYGRIAASANCSLFHFLRMFEVVAGVTVGEYVRRRRLSLAALALSAGGESDRVRVIDLAAEAGYDSPDAFAKAFKREFGITPSEAREGGAKLRIWLRIGFSVVLKGDVPMEYRIEKKGAIAMTGLPLRANCTDGANLREIPAFWGECIAKGHMDALERAMPENSKLGVMGVCANDMDAKTQTFTYLIAIERPETEAARARLPSACVDFVVPEASWAIFPSRGPMLASIQALWQRIYSDWFPNSDYEHAGGHELEVYSEGDMQAADYYCEVWIPVKRTA